jgi:hypothetical protein
VHNKAIGFGQQTDPKWHGDDSCWSEFAILLAAALLGGLAIIPYGVSLLTSNQRKPLKFPPPDALAAVISSDRRSFCARHWNRALGRPCDRPRRSVHRSWSCEHRIKTSHCPNVATGHLSVMAASAFTRYRSLPPYCRGRRELIPNTRKPHDCDDQQCAAIPAF